MRLGLVGRGPWAKNIERTLLSFDDIVLVRITRGEPCPDQLDGALIASSSVSHAEVALPFLDAGIPTFIEKPMATSIADAERIKRAAERSGAAVFVGHIQLHNPAFLQALEILPTLGRVSHLICEGMNDRPRADSSVFWDWLPHHLSMAHAVFGDYPLSTKAWGLSESSCPYVGVAKFSYAEASLLSVVSWASPARRRRLTVSAEKGTLIFDDASERKLALRAEEGVSYPSYEAELPLTRELRAFVHGVRSGTIDHSHLDMGVRIVRVIAAVEESASKGGEIIHI